MFDIFPSLCGLNYLDSFTLLFVDPNAAGYVLGFRGLLLWLWLFYLFPFGLCR